MSFNFEYNSSKTYSRFALENCKVCKNSDCTGDNLDIINNACTDTTQLGCPDQSFITVSLSGFDLLLVSFCDPLWIKAQLFFFGYPPNSCQHSCQHHSQRYQQQMNTSNQSIQNLIINWPKWHFFSFPTLMKVSSFSWFWQFSILRGRSRRWT